MATKAKGSLETRPWLPDGYSLGFTSSQTEKREHPETGDTYEARIGRVVIVRDGVQTLRDEPDAKNPRGRVLGHDSEFHDVQAFDSEADAWKWAKDAPADTWRTE